MVLDSSYTFHICPNREWFSTSENISKGVVLIDHDAINKTAGVGSVKLIKMFDVVVRTLRDVKHVPNVKRNLISLSTLNSKGHKYISEGRVLKVGKGALIVMKG